MRILYLANIRVPTERSASGLQIMQMCAAFAQAGHSVELVATSRFKKTEDPFSYFNVERNFTLTRVTTPAILLPRIYSPKLSRIRAVIDLLFLRIRFFFKKYDVLYTRQPLTGIFFRDFILELHVLPQDIKQVNLFMWRRARKIVSITHTLKQRLVEHGIPEEKILVAPDAVDLEKFTINVSQSEARDRLGLPQQNNIALYAGYVPARGVRGKFETLCGAARSLPENVSLYIVGGRVEDAEVFSQVMQEIPNLHIISQRPHQEMPLWLRAADVLILLNTAHHLMSREYTSPMKLFEYMAAERPIVASDVPSVREILNEHNASFVRPDAPVELASGIKQLVDHKEESAAKARQARADVERFTWAKRADEILRFIGM